MNIMDLLEEWAIESNYGFRVSLLRTFCYIQINTQHKLLIITSVPHLGKIFVVKVGDMCSELVILVADPDCFLKLDKFVNKTCLRD